ncbi:MAG: Gx transporter family protein [Oscillospiraceae bacterium]|nr:Gx transporter family protein [Oscillospiraceae bacterium]
MNTKRLVYCALLTAIALTIFMVESQIPLPVAIPGMKLGLANIVTVYAMFALGPGNTLLILLCRIVLSSLFAGGSTIFYSLAGGLLCYVSMLLLRKLLTVKQLWACGAIGAIFHNIGQIGAAIAIYQVPQLIVYLPFLLVVGIIAGAFTGLAAQFLLARIGDKIKL